MRTLWLFLTLTGVAAGAAGAQSVQIFPSAPQIDPSAEAAFEQEFWNTVKASDNVSDLEAYLRQFPDGQFRDDADARIRYLLTGEAPEAGPVEADEAAIDAFDEEFWAAIQDTKNATDLQAYLLQFPDGKYRAEAEARIQLIEEGLQNGGS